MLLNWALWWSFRNCITGTTPVGAINNSSSSPKAICIFWMYFGTHSATYLPNSLNWARIAGSTFLLMIAKTFQRMRISKRRIENRLLMVPSESGTFLGFSITRALQKKIIIIHGEQNHWKCQPKSQKNLKISTGNGENSQLKSIEWQLEKYAKEIYWVNYNRKILGETIKIQNMDFFFNFSNKQEFIEICQVRSQEQYIQSPPTPCAIGGGVVLNIFYFCE